MAKRYQNIVDIPRMSTKCSTYIVFESRLNWYVLRKRVPSDTTSTCNIGRVRGEAQACLALKHVLLR